MKQVRLILISLLCVLLLAGCTVQLPSAAAEKHQRQVFAMDTVMILTAYGDDTAEQALDAAEARILALEADLDPEREGSSVWTLNQNAGQWVPVSADCFAIAETAMLVADRSGGALAPQLYSLILRWGFITGEYRVPEQAEIDAELASVAAFPMDFDADASALRIPEGSKVAFGAVAKGYTAQAALEAMEAAGCETAILSLGGNVQTLGQTKADGSAWKVAVADPHDPGEYAAMLKCGEKAVVTSGGYQRYFEQDGKTYIHIIDPATGYPVENGLLSMTIVCNDGCMADALSTSMFVLGEQGAIAYRRAYGGFEMVMITDDGRMVVTEGLRDSFETAPGSYDVEYVE